LEKGFVWGKNKLFFYAINYSIFFPYLCHKFIVMKKTFLLLSLATTLLVACNKPDNPIPNGGMPLPTHIDPSYKVGDYFHNDTRSALKRRNCLGVIQHISLVRREPPIHTMDGTTPIS